MNPRKSGTDAEQNVGCTGFSLVLSSLPVGGGFAFRLRYSCTLIDVEFVSIFPNSFVTSLFGRPLWFAFVCLSLLTSMHLSLVPFWFVPLYEESFFKLVGLGSMIAFRFSHVSFPFRFFKLYLNYI